MGAFQGKQFRGGILRQLSMTRGIIGVLSAPLPVAAAGATHETPAITDPDAGVRLNSASLERWRAKNRDNCLMPGEAPDSKTEQLLNRFYGYIRQSELADRLYQDLSGGTATLCTNAATKIPASAAAIYLIGQDAAIINANGAGGRVVLSGLHELRHGWQDQNRLLDRMLAETKQNRFAALYMVEADAAAFAVAGAYQLKQAGATEAWEAAQKSPTYKPLTEAFEREIGTIPDGAKLSDGQIRRGMQGAFHAWFDNSGLDKAYTDRHLEGWRSVADSGIGRAVNIRQLAMELGKLPGSGGRPSPSYMGIQEIKKAQSRALELVERQQTSPRDNPVGNPLLTSDGKPEGPKRVPVPGSSSGAI
ncbi:MAG: hypothetical protein KI792_09070 [Alphaproteobacteria bacterium]|nr:hypothetical protein [Alphaproteobacteria bacterium SS10]